METDHLFKARCPENHMELRDELKKTFLTEPIKILIGLAVVSGIPALLTLSPVVRDQWWPAVPKWFLLITSLFFFSLFLLLLYKNRKYKNALRKSSVDESSNVEKFTTSVSDAHHLQAGIEPNIICKEKYLSFIRADAQGDDNFYEATDRTKQYDAILLTFLNEPVKGRVIKQLDVVKAQITFNTLDGNKELAWVTSGVWLGTPASTWFKVGGTQKLLLCITRDSGISILDKHHSSNGLSFKELGGDAKNGFTAIVKLLGDDQWIQENKFTVTRVKGKKWSITQIIEAQA